MSQYPSPYQPPSYYNAGYYGDPYAQHLAPARRASLLMFILGGLMLMCGGLMATFFAAYDVFMDVLRRQQPAENIVMPGRPEFLIAGIFAVVCAFLLIGLGVWVRQGSRAGAITSIVLSSLLLLLATINLMAALSMPGTPAASRFGSAVCMVGFMIVPLVILLIWLGQAAGAAGQARAAMEQYQAQYWQYMQQQQRYAQGAPSAPPPPPAQTPPPPPPPPPPPGQA